jgi:hypothetical protein
MATNTAPASKKWWFERNSVLSMIILLFIVTVSADFTLGLFLNHVIANQFRIRHSYYHHGLLPNKKAIATWGPIAYPFYTNSLGMRDIACYHIPPVTNRKRILLLGDSHTEAVGVYAEDSFYGILKKEGARYGIDVLNGAVVSYSPRIHLLKARYLLEQKHLKLDEIWVFIDLSDLQNEIAYETFTPDKENLLKKTGNAVSRFLRSHSLIVNRMARIIDNHNYSRFAETVTAFDHYRETKYRNNTIELYKEFFKDFSDKDLIRNPEFHGVGKWYYDSAFINLADKGLNLGMENIRELNDLCRQRNIRLKLSVHPWQIQVMKHDTCDYYVRRWSDFCRDQHIDFINLFPVFINEENPELVTKKYFISNDNHWSESGHEKVGRFLIQYLKP